MPDRPAGRRASLSACLGSAAILVMGTMGLGVGTAGAAEALEYRRAVLDLPGVPSKLLPVDLDGDGRLELLIVIVYTEYEAIAFERTEGFVQLTEVVPALAERRELRVYRLDPESLEADGQMRRPIVRPLQLPLDVNAIGAEKATRAIALTRDGIASIKLGEESGTAVLTLDPELSQTTILRGSRTFLPELALLHDLDGDEWADLLLPTHAGFTAIRGAPGGFDEAALPGPVLPGTWREAARGNAARYPIPRVEDVDGDGTPDLVVPDALSNDRIHVIPGAGAGTFLEPRSIDLRCLDPVNASRTGDLVQFGDVDGVPGAELALMVEHEMDGLDEARKPRATVRLHHLRGDFSVDPVPYGAFEIVGHPFAGALAGRSGEPFRDLDADGRKELITVELDFSMWQVLRVLTTKRFGMGLDFQVYRQKDDGGFDKVEGLRLSDKLLIDLDDLSLDRLGNFAGDFDADGRPEFLTLKGGRTLEIHRGRAGCAYARRPDLELRLIEEPRDPGLMRVLDIDGDGRSDIAITRPLASDPSGATTPVALDLYLSRGSP